MKKPAKLLLRKATDSLVLCIGHFNGPSDRGRPEAVLLFMDHAFEMLLKAAILHRGGKIRNKGEPQTIGFDECLRRAFSTGSIRFLNDTQVLTLQVINGLRDAAYHHIVEVSEDHLYINAQAGVTLFRDILRDVFKQELSKLLPARVLPVSTKPILDIGALFANELDQVRVLLRPGARRRTEAAAKLKALAIVEGSIQGQRVQPTELELKQLMMKVSKATSWEELFPGVASLKVTTEGSGPSISLRLTKKNEGAPVQLVQEGSPGATVVAVRRVDELGFFSLGRDQVAQKLGLTPPKTTAAIRHFGIQRDPGCYKEFVIGRSIFGRYSPKAIETLRHSLASTPIDRIWELSRSQRSPHSRVPLATVAPQ